jgi:hypothetical protein
VRLQTIITQRERGDFWALDANQYVFRRDCTLEAMRTQAPPHIVDCNGLLSGQPSFT